MKRIVFWALSTLSVLVLLFGYSTSTSGPLTNRATTVSASGVIAGTSTSTTSTTGTTSTTEPSATDGTSAAAPDTTTITGDPISTRYGPVQVEITMSGTSITEVKMLEYPSSNGKDAEINRRALPTLIQETLDAQSASVDMVSGATFTSNGYLESLQSALDQAGA